VKCQGPVGWMTRDLILQRRCRRQYSVRYAEDAAGIGSRTGSNCVHIPRAARNWVCLKDRQNGHNARNVGQRPLDSAPPGPPARGGAGRVNYPKGATMRALAEDLTHRLGMPVCGHDRDDRLLRGKPCVTLPAIEPMACRWKLLLIARLCFTSTAGAGRPSAGCIKVPVDHVIVDTVEKKAHRELNVLNGSFGCAAAVIISAKGTAGGEGRTCALPTCSLLVQQKPEPRFECVFGSSPPSGDSAGQGASLLFF